MNDCLFCKIITGEIPSQKIYEDEKTFAFLDVNPVNEGHTLVVPKNHSTNIFDVASDDWSAVMETVRKLSAPIETAMEASGINLMMNNRENAGQIIDHVHIHIIPRQKDDGLKLWAQHPYAEGEDTATQEKIIEALSQ